MYRGFNGMGYGYGYSGFPWGALAIGLGFAVVVAGIIYIVVKIGKNGAALGGKGGGASAAAPEIPFAKGLEILAERFARGEIDGETYQAMKREMLG